MLQIKSRVNMKKKHTILQYEVNSTHSTLFAAIVSTFLIQCVSTPRRRVDAFMSGSYLNL